MVNCFQTLPFNFNLRHYTLGNSLSRTTAMVGHTVQVEPGLTPLAFRAFQRLKLKCDNSLLSVAFNFSFQLQPAPLHHG